MTRVLPLIEMVRSQDTVSVMTQAVKTSTVQRGPLQVLVCSMIDLQYRMTGLERESSPVPSLSLSLDYVPAGIYQGRRVWAAPVTEEDHAGQGNGP